jgi:hypothetical protein
LRPWSRLARASHPLDKEGGKLTHVWWGGRWRSYAFNALSLVVIARGSYMVHPDTRITMTTWPLDFGPCFVFQKDELLRTPLLGTSVNRDKREPKPQTRQAPIPPHGGKAPAPLALAPAPRGRYVVVTMYSNYEGGRHLRQGHDEQGARALLPACPLLQGGRQGQAGGPRPPRYPREARGRVGGVAL